MNHRKLQEFCQLLLNTCLRARDSLFVSCNKFSLHFGQLIIDYAKGLGISDIYLDVVDFDQTRKILNQTAFEDIKHHPYFQNRKWDEYAEKGASFLILKTHVPEYLNDVDPRKLIESMRVTRESQAIYKEKQLSYKIPWCITALPNKIWAEALFPDEKDGQDKLMELLFDLCMVEGDGLASERWARQKDNNSRLVKKLNSLKIERLIYKSPRGTNLQVGLSPNAVWMGVDKGNMIVNMPSYEVYTAPDCNRIEGVVYSTKPLVYGGILIEDFALTFRGGKIVEAVARQGQDALRDLIASTKGADRLGEVALVDNRSPVSRSGINFGLTLLDENASCHFALGNAYPVCLKNYSALSGADFEAEGFNRSGVHVDFMVGDDGLDITALTNQGTVQLMTKGEIVF